MTKNLMSIVWGVFTIIILLFLPVIAISQLRADFSASPVSGCPPVVVNFKDISTGNPATWSWDLGNGTTSTSKNPTATYFDPGAYTIKLVVRNASGADSVIKSGLIVVNALPAPDFEASDTMGCYPLKTVFADKSTVGTGTIKSWQWDFGDGTLSDLQNPSHTFTDKGEYSVTLKVINSDGCTNFITKSAYIKLQNGVKSNFSYTSSQGCSTPTPVNFKNLTNGTGSISYKWDFGDGNSSTLTNPVNSYQTPGVYTVKLVSITSYGCADTMIKSNAINIGAVKADFINPGTVCSGKAFQVTNSSSPSSFVSSFWDFGDGTTSTDPSPVKIYASPGDYQIKTVTNFGSCQDSVTKKITALPQPKGDFTATNTRSCVAPLEVTFSGTSAEAVSYHWIFGDSAVSDVQNPVHTYVSSGSFTVILVITNSLGCTDTIVKPNFVNVVPLKIASIDSLPANGCAPLTVSPVAVLNDTAVTAATYLWDFGDGATSALEKPTHEYTTTGKFNVKLQVTTASGCIDTLTIVNAVRAGIRPTANFSSDTLDLCTSKSISFTDRSAGAVVDKWFWTFGDGTTSTDSVPRHRYADTGYYTISLIAYNNGCSDTITKKNYIYVEPPIARFNTSFLCSSPGQRTFKDTSVLAQTWNWDFGDNSIASGQNVSHAYAAAGTYKVSLFVTNGACKDTATANVLVLQSEGKLQASDSLVCVNSNVLFTVTGIDPTYVKLYSWYINGITNPATVVTGDNKTLKSYNKSGTWPAAVIITDLLNCTDTLYSAVPIQVFGPKAGFGTSAPGVCVGNSITFTDSSNTDGVHTINNYTWNFGDGNIQSFTAAPVAHRYDSSGVFGVRLTVTDTYGCRDSIFKPGVVTIARPVASFSLSDTLVCPNSSVTFNNATEGARNTYLWKFGDGKTSADINPVHAYTQEGSYPVQLTVTDEFGCSDSVINYINVVTTTSRFLMSDSFSNCPPLVVNFTNNSKGYLHTLWDFGDGAQSSLTNSSHIFTIPGTYFVKLHVSNNSGCTDSLVKKVIVRGPNGALTYNPLQVCSPGKVTFTAAVQGAVKFVWDYQEGNPDSSIQNVSSHVYTTPGLYLPRIVVEDVSGCRVAISGKDTIMVNSIVTQIVADKTILCDSGTIHFSDSTVSLLGVTSYNWSFGDGSSSSTANVQHAYSRPGAYTVTLQVIGQNGCTDTATQTIKVVKPAAVSISSANKVCAFDSISFSGQVATDTSTLNVFAWNFGNGQNSSLQTPPPQIYNVAGSQTVSLAVTNSSGCTSTATKPIIVNAVPQLVVSPNAAICIGNSTQLSVSGAVAYSWLAPANNLSCTNCTNPVANPSSDNIYKVKGTNADGCSSVDSISVKVFQPFKITVSGDTSVCSGSSVQLFAGGAPNFTWSPAAGLSSGSVASPVASPSVTTTYQVVGYDTLKCRNDTGMVTVTVNNKPTVNIGATQIVPAGTSVVLNSVASADVTSYQWSPFYGLSCTDCASPQFIAKDDVTYKLTVFNQHCSTTASVAIKVTCNNIKVVIPNAFSPNGDGINDVFFPTGNGALAIKQMIIYNRWGQQLFGLTNVPGNNPTYGWNGTSNGKLVDVGVYYYYIEIVCANEQVVKYTGNITLLR